MPSLSSRARNLGSDYVRVQPRPVAPIAPVPPVPIPTPLPVHLTRSQYMITSMPGVTATLDGATRQFYGGRVVPTRRVNTPGS